MKKIVSGLMATVMLASLASFASCGGEGSDGAAMINIMNTGGGIGRVWLDEAIARYQEKNPNIMFNVEHNLDTGVGTMQTSGYSIYFVEQGGIAEMAAAGKLLPITDLLTETNEQRDGKDVSILDKVKPETRSMLKGFDGEYYALPHFTWFPGLTYDAELFTAKGYYFADYDLTVDNSNVTLFDGDYGKAKFVGAGKTDVKKSVGNDGEAGTYDDGLPTTLQELCILCEKMKGTETTPIELNGTVSHYISYIIRSMWASLSGYEQMKVTYTFDGNVDCVTGYQDGTSLLPGVVGIKKPVVETKKITEETGYLVNDNVARYYVASFVKLIKDNGWLSKDHTSNTLSPATAQAKFLCNGYNEGGETYGMLLEGNYWYNEAVANKAFKTLSDVSGGEETQATRDIRWMPLPTALDTPVTGKANARGYTMMQGSNSFAFVNANIKNNTNLVKEVKKFLAFLYTDVELSHFVGTTGIMRGFMNHELLGADESKLSNFQKSVFEVYDDSKVVFNAADNNTFLKNADTLSITTMNKAIQPTIGTTAYMTYLDAFSAGCDLETVFEATRRTAAQWENIYEGGN